LQADEELMSRVKTHNDHEAFARLVQRWEQPIHRLCTRMTGDASRGEDLKQETFLRVFQARKTYQPTARFSTFLWRIALNLCYDELRRDQRRAQFPRDDEDPHGQEAVELPPAEDPGPDLRAARSEEAELVRRALLQLPEIYRSVIVLRHYEDLKLVEIAEVLEIPEGTVNSRMAEALSRLSRMLEPQLCQAARPALRPNPSIQEKFVL
jgi:RNA polymerase sigma-70 factor, ECF subfamily